MQTAPWLEKYRPRTLNDVCGNEDVVHRLRHIAKNGNLPNVLLCGTPGTGKTSSILALARELLGDSVREAVLELNASDNRGIDTVRNQIVDFARKRVTLPPGRTKLIILDEVDAMTGSAQQALRRVMELYSETTRFALACNYPSKVIEPIQSRCAVLRFGQITDKQMTLRLQQIANLENLEVTPDAYELICTAAQGDMRVAVNVLQACHVRAVGVVDRETVDQVVDLPNGELVREVLGACIRGETRNALTTLWGIIDSGFGVVDVVNSLFYTVTSPKSRFSESFILAAVRVLGDVHMKIAVGGGANAHVLMGETVGSLVLAAKELKLC